MISRAELRKLPKADDKNGIRLHSPSLSIFVERSLKCLLFKCSLTFEIVTVGILHPRRLLRPTIAAAPGVILEYFDSTSGALGASVANMGSALQEGIGSLASMGSQFGKKEMM